MTALPADRVLILAQSGRMFAQSARQAGFEAHVIDQFGDLDTQRQAKAVRVVSDFAIETLLQARRDLLGDSSLPLIYGSGLDGDPSVLEALQGHGQVIGNPPGVVARARDPRRFFALLAQLQIPFPETRFSVPSSQDGWLAKSACGEGGKRVAFLANFRLASPHSGYFQRFSHGTPCSLVFLANGKSIRAVGFNTQLTTSSHQLPFLFAGAINAATLTPLQRETATAAAARLTESLGLRGMNSLDFMAEDEAIRVLEINPRPGATAQLYDGDFPKGWLAAHIQACHGLLPEVPSTSRETRGFRTLFATAATVIPLDWNWPEHCRDLPAPGSRLAAGDPVCTVTTQAHNVGAVQDRLTAMENALLTELGLPARRLLI